MRVTYKMIDKQLWLKGFLINLVSSPSLKAFERGRKFSKRFIGKKLKGFQNEEIWIPRANEDSKIRVRIFKPLVVKEKLPVVLYCHGGGYAITIPEMSFPQIKQLLTTRDCIVVSPDYIKSLEKPYPAAINDCYDTLKWIKNNIDELGGKSDQIMVAGHSAGGGLTAAVTLMARDKKEINIAFQMPIYPMIDDRMTSESAFENSAPIWNGKMNAFGWSLYLKDLHKEGEEIPIYAAPARATDYSNLPPTATYVGDLEPFRDETIEYVENLKKEGIPVEFKLFKGCYHGFDGIVPKAKVSKAAIAFITNAFSYAVDNYFSEQIIFK
jgi:acetyl esterase/lipase